MKARLLCSNCKINPAQCGWSLCETCSPRGEGHATDAQLRQRKITVLLKKEKAHDKLLRDATVFVRDALRIMRQKPKRGQVRKLALNIVEDFSFIVDYGWSGGGKAK